MAKFLPAFLLFHIINLSVYSQGTISPDDLVLKIPQGSTYTTSGIVDYIKQNFSSDTSRLRVIYVWVTNNINYDIAKVRARNANIPGVRQPVEDVLKTRNAVCQGYADLFVELCNGLNIKATLVGGYTKKGGVVSTIPHAWVAAELAGNWYLFDPTWGAGYIRNDQFVRSFNNSFYKILPADMVKDHMPFDPMYQCLNYTITNKEFIEGQTNVNKTKPFFNYNDTLKQYALLSPTEKIRDEARRLQANGIHNDLILERFNFLKNGVQSYASNDKYEEARIAFNQATDLFTQYIEHKNKQFTTIEDNELKQMMDSISYQAKLSRSLLVAIVPKSDAQRQTLTNTYHNLEKFQSRVVSEKDFIARYLNTDKAYRRQLFARN